MNKIDLVFHGARPFGLGHQLSACPDFPYHPPHISVSGFLVTADGYPRIPVVVVYHKYPQYAASEPFTPFVALFCPPDGDQEFRDTDFPANDIIPRLLRCLKFVRKEEPHDSTRCVFVRVGVRSGDRVEHDELAKIGIHLPPPPHVLWGNEMLDWWDQTHPSGWHEDCDSLMPGDAFEGFIVPSLFFSEETPARKRFAKAMQSLYSDMCANEDGGLDSPDMLRSSPVRRLFDFAVTEVLMKQQNGIVAEPSAPTLAGA